MMKAASPRSDLDRALDALVVKWRRPDHQVTPERQRNLALAAERSTARARATALQAAVEVLDTLQADGRTLAPRTTIFGNDGKLVLVGSENILPRLSRELVYVARAMEREARLASPRRGRPRNVAALLVACDVAHVCRAHDVPWTDAANGQAATILRDVYRRLQLGELSGVALRPYLRYGAKVK